MRAHSPVSLVTLAAVSAGLAALAGCASDDDIANRQAEIASTINYGSFGTSAELDCGQGRSLKVGGSNNTLKVTGSCASVDVAGADNKITLARVDRELTVVGINNSVTYSEGDPAVDDAGSGNRINKG